MADRLDGARVAVIGGSSGIGFAVAQGALAAGAEVTVASSRRENVEAAVSKLGNRARGEVVDATDEASIAAFFETTGELDHLAYTSGDWTGDTFGPLAGLDLARLPSRMAVRFTGAMAAARNAKIGAGGSITLTSGMLAHRPMRGMALATPFGGAVEHLAQALAVELAPVRVNCVCPGLILTEHVLTAMSEEIRRRFTAGLPLPRAAEPSECAEAYLYCMRATYTTGQVLRVDGGGSLV